MKNVGCKSKVLDRVIQVGEILSSMHVHEWLCVLEYVWVCACVRACVFVQICKESKVYL